MLSFERVTSQQIVTLSSSRDSNDATYGCLLAQKAKQKQDLLENVLTSHSSKTKPCIKILFNITHQRKSESLKCDMIFNIESKKTSSICKKSFVHLFTLKSQTKNFLKWIRPQKNTLNHILYPRRVYSFRVGRKEYISSQNLCYRRLDVLRYSRRYSSHKLWNFTYCMFASTTLNKKYFKATVNNLIYSVYSQPIWKFNPKQSSKRFLKNANNKYQHYVKHKTCGRIKYYSKQVRHVTF